MFVSGLAAPIDFEHQLKRAEQSLGVAEVERQRLVGSIGSLPSAIATRGVLPSLKPHLAGAVDVIAQTLHDGLALVVEDAAIDAQDQGRIRVARPLRGGAR